MFTSSRQPARSGMGQMENVQPAPMAPATAETMVELPTLQTMEKTVECLQVVDETVGSRLLQSAEKTVENPLQFGDNLL